MPPREEQEPVPVAVDGIPEAEADPRPRWPTWLWLVIGVLVFWGGQRWLRDTPSGMDPQAIDAAVAMILGLIAVGLWAIRHWPGTEAVPRAPETVPDSWNPPWILGGLAVILTLASELPGTGTPGAAWLQLGALLLFLLAGASGSGQWTRQRFRQWGRPLRIGLGLTGAAVGVRLLLVPSALPDWNALSLLPTILGDLYRVLGSPRAVLLPFALACLWPAAVWWASRHFVREPWALTAGVLAILSPFHIWQPFPATPWGLTPFVFLFTVVAAQQVVSAPRPGSMFGLGLGLGILWGDIALWRPLILAWLLILLVPGIFLLMRRSPRPDWRQGLYAGLGLAAGLILYRHAALGEIAGMAQDAVAWGEVLYPPRILAFWFQPGNLDLPYSVTRFLFLDGLLALVGLALLLSQGVRRILPALGGLVWLGGLVYASQDADLFLSLAQMTAGAPLLLAAVALPVLLSPLRRLAAGLAEREISERWLVTGVIGLLLWQMPGGILGFNPLAQFRGDVQVASVADESVVVESVEAEPITTASYVGLPAPLWPADLVWQTAGTCQEGNALMTNPQGVALDLDFRQLHVVGGVPGRLVTLDIDQAGRLLAEWSEEFMEPVEVAVVPDGTLRILDAEAGGVWALDPAAGELDLLTGEQGVYRPRGFHVLPNYQILVAATGSDRVVHYGATGNLLGDFAVVPGTINLEQPTDVLSIGERLWVLSPHQSWLREMYSGLQLEVVVPSHTAAGPHMAALADGTFLVTDSEAGRILYLHEDGSLAGVVNTDSALLRRPVGIDVAEDEQGIWMAVTDVDACRVSLWLLDPAHTPAAAVPPIPQTADDFVDVAAPPWPADLVWQTAGTCKEDIPLMTGPQGVALDLARRQLHVVGGVPGRLVTLDMDRNGRLLAEWSDGLQEPVEVAVAPDGTLRILDAGAGGVWALDPAAGELDLLTRGQSIYQPRGFHVLPDRQILVAATGSNRIVRYDADGAELEDFAALPGAANLEQPTDVLAIGERLWVLSPQQSWLREMYSGLQLEMVVPSHTAAGPHMAALADSTFLVTDSEAGRILYLRADGRLAGVVNIDSTLLQRPVGIDVAEDEQGIWMAVTDVDACRVSLWLLDPVHKPAAVVAVALPDVPPTADDFVDASTPRWPADPVWQTAGTCHEGVPLMPRPQGVALDLARRQLHVVGAKPMSREWLDSAPGTLITLDMDQDGRLIDQWSAGLREPVEVAVLSDGTFRILDAEANGVWALDPVAGELNLLTREASIYRPRGLHVLPDRQMLVAATGSNRIVRYGADGAEREDFADVPGAANLAQPTDVLQIGDRLWVLMPEQSELREIYSGLQLQAVVPSHTLAGPHMAALADGTFLVTDSGAGRILYLHADGRLAGVVDIESPPLHQPVGIDVAEDEQGIWMAVTDTGTCQVSLWRLDPAGMPAANADNAP